MRDNEKIFLHRMCTMILFLAIISATHAEFEPLNCIACPEGFFLDQIIINCTRCPIGATTFSYSNASDISDCICTTGFENLTDGADLCTKCALDFYKDEIENVSCAQCFENSQTLTTGSESIDACVCNAGFSGTEDEHACFACDAGKYKSDPGDIACGTCPVDHFCPEQSIYPVKCPPNSSSSPGSKIIEECLCHAGFHYNNSGDNYHCVGCVAGKYSDVSNLQNCKNCPVNTFNTLKFANNLSFCLECPAQSTSNQASTKIQDCFCDLGYSGVPGSTCIACDRGFFRENVSSYICEPCSASTFNDVFAATDDGYCTPCQANTSSQEANPSQRFCVCDAGFYGVLSYEEASVGIYECILCQAGKFSTTSNTSLCTDCGIGKYSVSIGAKLETTCVECEEGKFSYVTGATSCTFCPNSTYTNLSSPNSQICNSCPAFSSHDLLGSTNVFDCICQAGYWKRAYGDGITRTFACELCLPGHFCPGDDVIIPCAFDTFSLQGQTVCQDCAELSQTTANASLTSSEQCQCVQGTFGSNHDACSLCGTGKYQPLDYTYDGVNKIDAELERIFTGALIGAPTAIDVQCLNCEFAKFQNSTGTSFCYNCPENSNTSSTASVLRTECICNPSYFGVNGQVCNLCVAGDFCPGGVISTSCRLHSTSLPGASSEADCDCTPGFYSVTDDSECNRCPGDHYCTGDLHLQACPANSNSRPGSHKVSQCTCNDGYWRECTLTSAGTYVNNAGETCTIEYNNACVLCGADDICFNNTLLHCPDFSTAPPGSSEARDCVCDGGYRAEYH